MIRVRLLGQSMHLRLRHTGHLLLLLVLLVLLLLLAHRGKSILARTLYGLRKLFLVSTCRFPTWPAADKSLAQPSAVPVSLVVNVVAVAIAIAIAVDVAVAVGWC